MKFVKNKVLSVIINVILGILILFLFWVAFSSDSLDFLVNMPLN